MSIFGIAKTYRSLQRLSEIVAVLVRNGFGHYVRRLNLRERFPRFSFTERDPEPLEQQERLPERITQVIQELGPTFVKLGQVLSSRPDVVPEELCMELTRLQDSVAPFPGEEAVSIVEREIGFTIEETFAEFDREPFASGSIGQVHYATLKDGSTAVVKVRRPGIDDQIYLDLGLLHYLADLAETYIPELQPYRLPAIVEELERGVRRELDFVVEGSFTSKFYEMFKEDEMVRTPKVFWELTTPHVLTLERIVGVKITDYVENEQSPIRRRELSKALTSSFCKQYFESGTFHADPHPGNLLVDERGRLALIDFGLVGHLSDQLMKNLSSVLISLDKKEMDIFCEVFADMGATSDTTDISQLQADLLEMVEKYYSMPMKRMDTLEVFSDVTRIARRNGIALPRDVILLAKSFVSVMTTARTLDPEFDFGAAIAPHVKKLILQRLSPKQLFSEARVSFWHLGRLLRWMPREMAGILRKVETGKLQFVFKHVGLDKWANDLDRSLNRLSVSIVVAAIVISSSMLMQMEIAPLYGSISALAMIGFFVAFCLGIALVIGIWRSGKI